MWRNIIKQEQSQNANLRLVNSLVLPHQGSRDPDGDPDHHQNLIMSSVDHDTDVYQFS